MTMDRVDVLEKKAWRTETVCQSPPWGFLGMGEGHLLYFLARDYYTGDGVIVDGGAFLGRSAWFFGKGLDDNARAAQLSRPAVHSFDNFLVNEPFTSDAIRDAFGQVLPVGASTRRFFDEATRAVRGWLEVHEGDFLTYEWPARPVEILLVDIAKSLRLNARIVEVMFPCLIPGVSVVVHQDYHHPWLPHLHVTMEYLHDYFELVEPKVDDSAVFRLTTAIPAEMVERAAQAHRLPVDTQVALMDAAVARMPPEHRRHVELARALLLGQRVGRDAMRDAMREIDRKYPKVENDPHWSEYHAQMQQYLAKLDDPTNRGWRLVQAGDVSGALALAEEVARHDERYLQAATLRLNCLRRLKRLDDAERVAAELHSAPAMDCAMWVEIAWLALEQGQHQRAVDAGRSGLAQAADNDEHQARCLNVMELGLSGLGRHDEAIACGTAAVNKLPHAPWIWVQHASVLITAGRPEEAERAAREALRLAPGNAHAESLLARAGGARLA